MNHTAICQTYAPTTLHELYLNSHSAYEKWSAYSNTHVNCMWVCMLSNADVVHRQVSQFRRHVLSVESDFGSFIWVAQVSDGDLVEVKLEFKRSSPK